MPVPVSVTATQTYLAWANRHNEVPKPQPETADTQ
jgi:hypothetical protein